MNKNQQLSDIRNHICDLLKQHDIYKMEILFYGERNKTMTEINCYAIDEENPIISADYIIDGDGISLTEIINGWLYDFIRMAIKTNWEKHPNYTGFLDMKPFYTGSAVTIENYKLQNHDLNSIYNHKNKAA